MLGTDRDAQRNAQRLAQTRATEPDVAHELALERLARRDYAGALQILEGAAAGKVSVHRLSLLLYLLGKNDRTADAHALIANLDVDKTPAIRNFVDWYGKKFDSQAAIPPASVAR
jgi:hypothetical protein